MGVRPPATAYKPAESPGDRETGRQEEMGDRDGYRVGEERMRQTGGRRPNGGRTPRQ